MDSNFQTGVRFSKIYSVKLFKYGLFTFGLLFCFAYVQAQENFSPQVKTGTVKNKILLINFKEYRKFLDKYSEKMTLKGSNQRRKVVFVELRDTSLLEIFKRDPNILFVDLKRKPHVEGDFDLANPAINKFNIIRKTNPDLNGQQSIVSIKEESFDANDINLLNRSFSTAVQPATTSQHATIMATLIGGGGNSSPLTHGAADHVTFTASDFNNLMPDDNTLFTSNNINIQNHSYGVNIENYYGAETAAYDLQAQELPTLVHVFSSGNIGVIKPGEGTYANLVAANLTGTFKQAKNVLVVNAIDSAFNVNALNSRGPTYDGRLKPELTAYGPSGTSEAAALVSSAVVLLQEKFKSVNGILPNVALTKALLISGADDIGLPGIDFINGYGNVNIDQTLSIIHNGQWVEATLVGNDHQVLPITIPNNARQLRIAISWIDPPASLNATTALVNDIDSWIDNNGNITYPWVLSTYPHIDSLKLPAKRKQDHLNNIEYITIDNPVAGTYNLHLTSGNLDQQKVSIAYYINTDTEFIWNFPVNTDKLTANTKQMLIWKAYSSTGDLFYSINNSGWNFISTVDFTKKKFNWTPPDVFSKAQLKMVVNGVDYVSDEFVISPELSIKTDLVCTDSVRISWKKINTASEYRVYTMGAQYLQEFETTTDTALVIHNPINDFFAVSPVLNNQEGIKSTTINYTQQGAFCYLNLFGAQRISANEVKVNLELGSLYNIQQVRLLKRNNLSSTELASLIPTTLNIEYLDNQPTPGTSFYYAVIILSNGEKIISHEITITIEKPGGAVLWPNPVTDDDYLSVISSGKGILRLSNSMGQIIFTKELTLLEDELDLYGLTPGTYFYQVIQNNDVTYTGRLIKL